MKKKLIIALTLFVAILLLVLFKDKILIDEFFKQLVLSIRCDTLTSIFKTISNLCEIIPLLVICVILFIAIKDKKIPMCIISNLGIIAVLNQVIKRIVKRSRPIGYRLIKETGFSFPSSHSMISMTFYGLLIYFIYKNVKNKKLKTTLCIIFSILILLTGFSRIYLGVHYATDVICGYLLSYSYLLISISLMEKHIFKK